MQYLLIPRSKWKMLQHFFENFQIGKSRHLDSSTTTQVAKIRSSMEDPVVPLERNLCGHPLAGLLWERQFEKILLKYGWEKIPIGNAYSYTVKKGYSFLCMCMTQKMAGKKQNIDPMWKVLNKEVDLGEPTSFLDHVYLGCSQRQCEISTDRLTITEPCLNPEFPQEQLKNCHARKICVFLRGHMIWKVMPRNVWNDIVSWQTKRLKQLYKVSAPCLDDHHFKEEEELKSVGELSKVCSQIVMKCLYLARIGGPDILWSVNKLARSITKWTKACDKRLSRLISYTHHTCDYKQYCHVGNTAKQCRLGLFQDSDFAGDLEDSKFTSGGTLCIFGSHKFVPISWMCKKQTSVSQCSTESEIISLGAGLRLDGIPVLDLWDLIVAVLHGNKNQSYQERGDPSKSPTRNKIHGKIDDLDNVDFISSNVNSSRKEALLYTFEDNEAVIKTIIKGRSPAMRHVSRTHRVALDWLFDRINLDPKIQITYIDTKNQLADILTKENFTRDEWSHLLCLFNISHFSSINNLDASEERVTAKSKPTMNLVSRYRVRDSNVLASTASESPRKTNLKVRAYL